MKTIWMIPAAVVMSAGCSEVSTPYPVGIPVTHEQAEAFNGTWQHEEGLGHLRHAGDGRMVGPKWSGTRMRAGSNSRRLNSYWAASEKRQS
jgi:hypothetical protein